MTLVNNTCSPPDEFLGNMIERNAIMAIMTVSPIARFMYCLSVKLGGL